MPDWDVPTPDTNKNRLATYQPSSPIGDNLTTALHEDAHKPSYLGEAVNAAAAPFISDAGTRGEVEQYGTQFVKTATLFLRGRLGLAGTLASYALDQMHPGDSVGEQMADGALGAAKGAGMRGIFSKVGALDVNPATKGIMLGASSRLVDSALTRQTFVNDKGEFSVGDGLVRIKDTALNPTAIGADIVTFGLAHGAFRGANLLSNGALERSPLFSTVFTGTTFGASNGAFAEISRQRANAEQLDLGKIAKHALIQGGLDSIAAVPGGMQARAAMPSYRARVSEDLRGSQKVEEELGLRSIQHATDGSGPRTLEEIKSALSNPTTEMMAIDAIRNLPERERMLGLQYAMQHSTDIRSLQFAMASVKPEQLAELTQSIVGTTSGTTREQLLGNLYVQSLGRLAPEQAVQTAQTMFTHMADLPAGEQGTTRALWESLPVTNEGVPQLRTELTQRMPATDVAKIVFGGADANTAQAATELAVSDPAALRAAAKSMTHLATDGHTEPLFNALQAWRNTHSLGETMQFALSKTSGEKPTGEFPPTAEFIEHLYQQSSPSERVQAVRALREAAMEPLKPGDEARTALAIDVAAKLQKIDPQTLNEHFFQPLQKALNTGENGFYWQTFVSGESTILQKTGRLPEGTVRSPELKLHGMGGVDPVEQTRVRTASEAGLRNPQQLQKLLGDGELGRLFPAIFGNHSEGGIVGRPQHNGHEFSLDEHTMRVLDNVREHPEFGKLSEKDQTNVLWAALLHDVGKRANEWHPGHEPISAAMGWGVLETLGYSTQRIQRITNLISDHHLMSYLPDAQHLKMLDDPAKRDYLATRYRHEPALDQLRILNESDIKALDSDQSYWTDEVHRELDRRQQVVGTRAQELSRNTLPILTTELPHQFGIVEQPGDYVFTGAKTKDGSIGRDFFANLAKTESRDSSTAVKVITPKSAMHLDDMTTIVPLVSGPSENLTHPQAQLLDTTYGAVRSDMQRFDTLNELQKSGNGLLRGAHDSLVHLMDGTDARLNNPALTGIGVVRKGQPVVFEGLVNPQQLGLASKPEWLSMQPAPNTVVVPQVVWENAQRLNIPIVMLD